MNENRTISGTGTEFDEGALLGELARMATSPMPEFVFLQELLKRAMLGLRAEAGALWMCDAERRLVLQQEVCLEQTGFLKDASFQAACEKPFAEVFRTGGVVWQQLEQETPSGEKTRRSLIMSGLNRNSQVTGLVQIFEAPWVGEEDRPRRMQFLGQLCSIATHFWQNHAQLPPMETPPTNAALVASSTGATPPGHENGLAPRVQGIGPPPTPPSPQAVPTSPDASPAAPATSSKEEEQWILSLYEQRNSRDVAYIAANECRRMLGADRVSVGEQFGPRVKIQAVSGQQAVSARSNAVRLLATLAEQVCATGEKLTFTGDTRKFPPQFETLLADYLLDSRSRVIIIQPVFGPKRKDPEAIDKPELEVHSDKPAPVGVLIIEQISETPLPSDLDARLDRISPHVGLAFDNAQACERVFLLPLWTFIGNWRSRLRGRTTWKVGAALAALALISLILTFIPWDYRVTGKGRMMPRERRGVFAPWDGDVFELKAHSGSVVHAGDVLLQIRNEELTAKLHTQEALLRSKEQEAAAIAAQLNDNSAPLSRSNEIELLGKQAQVKAEIEGTKLQVESLTRQFQALEVRAPIDGKIATFRIEEQLRKRPVKRGDLLLEIMDDTRDWRLEVEVPENRIGHILEAQRIAGKDDLKVKYMLATDTDHDYYGTLETLANRSVSSEAEGVVVPVYVALSETGPVPEAPSIGAEVTAKIYCGKRSLGYVWFGDVIEAIRKYFWL
jgi:multidrug resistance efflux pump